MSEKLDINTLTDFFINSVDETKSPKWTEEHISELLYNFDVYEKDELEKYKLMLFMVIRNNKVLPVGLKKGKTQKEITEMTKTTIKELEKMINFDKAKEFYEL